MTNFKSSMSLIEDRTQLSVNLRSMPIVSRLRCYRPSEFVYAAVASSAGGYWHRMRSSAASKRRLASQLRCFHPRLVNEFHNLLWNVHSNERVVKHLLLSLTQINMICSALATCNVSFHTLIAEMWVFPIPFAYVRGAVPFGIFLSAIFLCAVGRKQLQDKPNLIRDLWNQSVVVMVQISLCLVYPVYNAVYLRLCPTEKTLFVCALPIIKFMFQSLIAWSTKHIVEYMPGATVLTVEVFNGLYLAKCMQRAGSISTFLAIMAFDVFEFSWPIEVLRPKHVLLVSKWRYIMNHRV